MRARLAAGVLTVAIVVTFAATASAVTLTTTITTPANPSFVLSNPTGGTSLTVEGTTNAGAGDMLLVACTWGNGDLDHRAFLISAEVQGDGTFSASGRTDDIDMQTCVLRALPDPATDAAELGHFTGPTIGVSRYTNESDVARARDNGGLMTTFSTDFFVAGAQLGGYMEWNSVSSCGLTFSYPYDSAFGFAGDGAIASEPLFNCAGALYPNATSTDGRASILIDGSSALTSYGAWTVAAGSSDPSRTTRGAIPRDQYPAPTFTREVDPLTGDVTITETEPLVFCSAGNPGSGCSALVTAGATLTRTIVQTDDGRLATVDDTFSDTSGTARSLEVRYDQHVGRDAGESGAATRPTFDVDGGGYAARQTGDQPELAPEAPGIIGIQGDPDNGAPGLENPQGAIVYSSAPDAVRFGYANDPLPNLTTGLFPLGPARPDINGDDAAQFELTYERTLPAGGDVSLGHAYVQALTRGEADTVAALTAAGLVTPSLAIDSPADGATLTDATATVAGHAGDRFTAVTVTVNGVDAPVAGDGTWSLPVTLTPGSNEIVAIATNGAGKTTQVAETLIYTPPTVTTPTDSGGGTTTAPAPECVVAALAGAARADAVAALAAGHCTLGHETSEYSATVREGAVISASLPAGTHKGNSFPVDLVISLGPAPSVFSVPLVDAPKAGEPKTAEERKKAESSGAIDITVVVPSAGKVSALGTYSDRSTASSRGKASAAALKPGNHRLTYASYASFQRKATRLKIHLTPTKAGLATLKRKRARGQTLEVRVYVGYAPDRGRASTRLVKTVRLR